MTGQTLAVLAALAYGLAGVFIVRGKATARGDNGVFLSVILTAGLSCILWLGWGKVALSDLLASDGLSALAIFALAGLLANGLGRQSMYRATEKVGAVLTGLLRRLIPLFAIPCAFLILDERPDLATLSGGGLVLVGVLVYMRLPAARAASGATAGLVLGTFSALAYALAYTLRSLGLETVPDAALGAFVGALVGAASLLAFAVIGKGAHGGMRFLTVDHGIRHWLTALTLSLGQLLQFFALKTASVVSVAVLGTLEVLFSALIILLFTRCETVAMTRLLIASLFAMAGTALLFLE